MVKKILVTGFPHCGTTILRAKIGQCENTYDCQKEFGDPPDFNPNMPYDFYVWKHPFLHSEFRNNGFSIKSQTNFADTIVIPIIRNPWNCFTSLYKRGVSHNEFSIYDNKQGHSISYYNNVCDVITDAIENNYTDVYPIRYEDMFDNNFKNLREIFDKIGLKYNDNIFQNTTKELLLNNSTYKKDISKIEIYSEPYRVWQINQPFKNMNDVVDIPDDFSEILKNSPSIQKLGYSDPRITN
jgi:hypothetical protein